MKKTIFLLVKLIVSLSLLGLLFYRFPISWEKLRAQGESLNWGWVLFSLLMGALANLIGMGRWYLLLKTQGVPLSFSNVIGISWVSLFFSNFSIGIVGGDVARIFYLLKLYPNQKSQAVFSILLDRILGFLGLCAIALFILPLSWRWLVAKREMQFLTIVLLFVLGLGVLGLVSLLIFRKKNFGFFALLNRKQWGQKILMEIDRVIEACLQQKKKVLGACFGMSAGVHVSLILCGYGLARAFSLPVPLFLMMCMMPMVNVAVVLPITISGLGLRETLILFLFQISHLDQEKALLFSLSYWLTGLILAAGGGVFYIFYRCSDPLKNDKVTLS